MRKAGADTEELLGLPVLMALARRPMNVKELARALGGRSTGSIKGHLVELERLGYVVRRASDRRWQMIVVLRAEPLPVASHVPGVDGVGEVVLSPQRPVQDAVVAVAPAEEPVAVHTPKVAAPAPKVESVLDKKAKTLNLPAWLEELGELSIGAGARCSVCGNGTPIKYGAKAICPKCARVWRKVDAAGISHTK